MNCFQLKVHCGDETVTLCADGEKSILESLGTTHAPESPCGGRGICGKCSVELKGLLRSFDSGEIAEINGRVSACRFAPAGDCEIWLNRQSKVRIETAEKLKISGGGEGLGLAIDLGTTTVAAAVYDLPTGECLAEKSELNAQRIFGADVLSRIEHCRKGQLEEICRVTEKQLSSLTEENEKISRVSIVGNTVMEHLAAGLNPTYMAIPPFTPKSLFGECARSDIWPNAEVYFARCVSAYVGGDIAAGMLACGLENAEGLQLYVDIGTNGEIAMGNRHGYKTCATAAGPAFEGAEIECGMNAAEGAIDAVWAENGEIFAHVIGEGKAKGICGSGLIDAAAMLLDLGLLGRNGRLISVDKAPENLKSRFTEREGVRAFLLCDEVYVTQHDIRKIQLAKAAIRAGIETLMKNEEISMLTVAGGFGKHLNVRNAMRIGLIPHIPEEKVRQVGNAAAKGAALLLEDAAEEKLRAFADSFEYVDLSSAKEFSEKYISYLNF